MEQTDLDKEIGKVYAACIESGNAKAFFETASAFGLEPGIDQIADLAVAVIALGSKNETFFNDAIFFIEDDKYAMKYIKNRFGDAIEVRDLIVQRLCQYCEKNDEANFAFIVAMALHFLMVDKPSPQAEYVLKVAIAKNLNCFRDIARYLGREYTPQEREAIVDIVIADGGQKQLLDMIKMVLPATQKKIIMYFAIKGWAHAMGLAVKAIGRDQPTADEFDCLAKGVKAAQLARAAAPKEE